MERRAERNLAYFIGGVNGVGKSTFLKELTESNPEFAILKGSSAFMDWLGIEQGDYDSLRALPDDHKRQEFDKMMKKVLTEPSSEGKVLLVDAHYFHYKRGEMLDTTGDWIAMMNALFVVTADSNEVFTRVSEDEKERDLFPVDADEDRQRQMLDQYLEGTINLARQLSETHKVPLVVLENKQDNIESTVKEFLEAHAGIIGKDEE